MSESVKIELPQLKAIEEQIAGLQEKIIALESERQEIINAEALKIAAYSAGEEFEDRRGRCYRVDIVAGEYVNYADFGIKGAEPSVFVRYYGVQLFKKGTTGRRQALYPPDKANKQ